MSDLPPNSYSSSLRRSCRNARARVGPIPPGGVPVARATSAYGRGQSVNSARNRIRRRGDNSSTSFHNHWEVSASTTCCSGLSEDSAVISGFVSMSSAEVLI
jgi:hypothetical protein